MGVSFLKRNVRMGGVGLLLLALTLPVFARDIVKDKQLARTQFDTAERMREELNGRPVQERTRRDYQRVTDAYRRVYYGAPTSSKAEAAVFAVAELLAESGRRFTDSRALEAAIGQYEFLRREYPGSKHRIEALFTIGQIYKTDLHDVTQAKATFQDYLKQYPRSRLAEQAKAALVELDQPAEKKKKDKDTEPHEAATATTVSRLPLVTGIRHWSTPNYTRVAIDLEAEIQYQAGRVQNPDRIFFDLHDTKLASTLVGKSFDVQDGFLQKIRVAQFAKGITRVVLDVDSLSDYSAFLLPNPYRLIIDIHGRKASATKVAEKVVPKQQTTRPAEPAKTTGDPRPVITAPETVKTTFPHGKPLKLSDRPADGSTAPLKPELDELARARTAVKTAETRTAEQSIKADAGTKLAISKDSNPVISDTPKTTKASNVESAPSSTPNLMVKSAKQPASASAAEPSKSDPVRASTPNLMVKSAKKPASVEGAEVSKSEPKIERVEKTSSGADEAELTTVAHLDVPELKTSKPTSAPTFESVAPRETLPKSKRKPNVHEARPTASGQRSLTRALGLKIGRIVVDAGHGGHDTGTIGPNGLQEKDLVLDVALRLGKMLESKLGAEVVYTRDDDTFVPLETRTAIANQQQADLFVSIHANSSPDASARGVETYYLNFTRSADALEVAARENAVSQKSIHELQDLLKRIALKDKIEESREFANDVQQALWTGVSAKNAGIKNRGVKKAPFIVLIGANMPSILTEISFVSNPGDEKRLQKGDYRQKIAESIYKGISRYANGLSGIKVAQTRGAGGQ